MVRASRDGSCLVFLVRDSRHKWSKSGKAETGGLVATVFVRPVPEFRDRGCEVGAFEIYKFQVMGRRTGSGAGGYLARPWWEEGRGRARGGGWRKTMVHGCLEKARSWEGAWREGREEDHSSKSSPKLDVALSVGLET